MVLAISSAPADAYFERLSISSRAVSLGGAFVAVADDASAVVINPAGLTQVSSLSFLSSFDQPYSISDLQEHFLAAAIPSRFGTIGLSWHRFALRDVMSEDLVTIAFGRDYIRTSQDASLSFGGSVDIARVAHSDTYTESKTVVTGSLSVLLRPFPIIGIGYSIRNLGQPSFDWLPGDGRTNLKMTQTFGLAYHWQRSAVILYEHMRGQDGEWADRFGIEVNAGKDLRIRGGLSDGEVSGGMGVEVSTVVFDVGVTGHDALGLTYYVSIGASLPSDATKDPY